MNSAPPLAAVSWFALGGLVFAANAGVLILQLVAGRLIAPFVGSSLETGTAVIGVFLAGIAVGNGLEPHRWFARIGRGTLAIILLAGALSALWMLVVTQACHQFKLHAAIPFGLRIIVLAVVVCFPVAMILSLLTPLVVRLGTGHPGQAGRVAGVTFALGTLGCLLGNYVTGFHLIPALTVNTIVFGVAAGLVALIPFVRAIAVTHSERSTGELNRTVVPWRFYFLVFACSFAGMMLELSGVRALAMLIGVSLFTWTGAIGVMLAGTATGNWLGGILADASHRSSRSAAITSLAVCLVLAAGTISLVLGVFIASQAVWFETWPIVPKVLAWSFFLYFLPFACLGTISPQVVRLSVVKGSDAGSVAGRIYAVSTVGAIAGTFATGFILIAQIGMLRSILVAALLPLVAAFYVTNIWQRKGLLYATSIIGGIVAGGIWLFTPENTKIALETNYFTIQVNPAKSPELARQGVLTLRLDLLNHSWVKPDDPTFLYYQHERIAMAILRERAEWHANPNVLVIGGGGYTFPRAAKTIVPACSMDVVEIDPGVTRVSYEKLALDPALAIRSFHRDGRQFVAEQAGTGSYDLITMDAVNDLSVPSHLLTREFHDRIREVLTPNGVYLVSIIDQPSVSRVLPAVIHTLRQTFPHVELFNPNEHWDDHKQTVFVVYASNQPYDEARMMGWSERAIRDPRIAWGGGIVAASNHWNHLNRPRERDLNSLVTRHPPLILTDQYAPVDWLMADVFRRRTTGDR